MIYTGIDGKKIYSVSYSPFTRKWKESKRKGRKIYVIPSDKCLVRVGEAEVKSKWELREILKFEVEEFGDVLWDFSLSGDKYYLTLVKDYEPPDDFFALDCEIFSFVRLSRILNEPNLAILDIGRRKTTYVETENHRLKLYRVLLKGGDYITEKLSREFELSPERAEYIKIEEGLSNEVVRSAFTEILEGLGLPIHNKKILLSGGGTKLKGIEEVFKNPVRNPYVPPELNSAFSAALKFVYKDDSPSFKQEELSPKESRALLGLLAAATVLVFSFSLGKETLKREFLKELNEKKKELFVQKFPELPPVLVEEQLRSLAGFEGKSLLAGLKKVLSQLPEGVRILEISYKNGIIKIRGVAREDLLNRIKNPSEVRKTPEGLYEFEVRLQWS
ncbi:cell division FtsA domain-containing protein [Aquifex sp.]